MLQVQLPATIMIGTEQLNIGEDLVIIQILRRMYNPELITFGYMKIDQPPCKKVTKENNSLPLNFCYNKRIRFFSHDIKFVPWTCKYRQIQTKMNSMF